MAMNKAEAAAYLGISTRSLERYTQDGRIGAIYERGKTRPVAMYDEADLQALKASLDVPMVRPTVELAKTEAKGETGETMELIRGLIALIQPPDHTPRISPEHLLLLKLTDAQALTGLSRQTLANAIKEGKLPAIKVGRAWRVKPAELKNFIAGL